MAKFSILEIHFLFFNEFREGTYTPLWGVGGKKRIHPTSSTIPGHLNI
jgi:hypothetical protein